MEVDSAELGEGIRQYYTTKIEDLQVKILLIPRYFSSSSVFISNACETFFDTFSAYSERKGSQFAPFASSTK